MQEQYLKNLLDQVQKGKLEVAAALEVLRDLPLEVLESARIDHHRSLRTGLPEVVFAESKTVEQLQEILAAMLRQPAVVLATRVTPQKAEILCRDLPELTWHAQARMLSANAEYIPQNVGRGEVLIVTAGTSDLPVAEEARLTLSFLGHRVCCIHDVGVAALHRILAHRAQLRKASVIIAVAGMDGALPSVVAGLSPAPVIGLPSSVGYGAGMYGFSALFTMLNSCSPGLAVVNIDNGFGAACMAAAINRQSLATC